MKTLSFGEPFVMRGQIAQVVVLSAKHPGAILWSIDGPGWAFMSLATLFAAPAFGPDRLGLWIWGLFFAHGVVGVPVLLVYFVSPPIVPNAQCATLAVVEVTWDPMHFVMEERMLRGIKERAEGQPPIPAAVLLAARVGWLAGALTLLGIFFARRHGYLWLLVPLAFAVLQFSVTHDPNAALAGFLAVGITVAGALVFASRWWSAYALIAASVALVLLPAPDAYVAFGLLFDLIFASAIISAVYRSRKGPTTESLRSTRPAAREGVIMEQARSTSKA